MTGIVNLRTVKKQRARAERRAQGDGKAARSGLTKAERDLARARAEKAARDLDGHRRGDD